jgi:hypothetical protein
LTVAVRDRRVDPLGGMTRLRLLIALVVTCAVAATAASAAVAP